MDVAHEELSNRYRILLIIMHISWRGVGKSMKQHRAYMRTMNDDTCVYIT